jgi:tuftelin-interacting protein 11
MTEEVAFVKSEDTGIWMPTGLEELMVLAGAGGH